MKGVQTCKWCQAQVEELPRPKAQELKIFFCPRCDAGTNGGPREVARDGR